MVIFNLPEFYFFGANIIISCNIYSSYIQILTPSILSIFRQRKHDIHTYYNFFDMLSMPTILQKKRGHKAFGNNPADEAHYNVGATVQPIHQFLSRQIIGDKQAE